MSEPKELENLPKIKVTDHKSLEIEGKTLAEAVEVLQDLIKTYGPDSKIELEVESTYDQNYAIAYIEYEREETDYENLNRTINFRKEEAQARMVADTIKNMTDKQVELLNIHWYTLKQAREYLNSQVEGS